MPSDKCQTIVVAFVEPCQLSCGIVVGNNVITLKAIASRARRKLRSTIWELSFNGLEGRRFGWTCAMHYFCTLRYIAASVTLPRLLTRESWHRTLIFDVWPWSSTHADNGEKEARDTCAYGSARSLQYRDKKEKKARLPYTTEFWRNFREKYS